MPSKSIILWIFEENGDLEQTLEGMVETPQSRIQKSPKSFQIDHLISIPFLYHFLLPFRPPKAAPGSPLDSSNLFSEMTFYRLLSPGRPLGPQWRPLDSQVIPTGIPRPPFDTLLAPFWHQAVPTGTPKPPFGTLLVVSVPTFHITSHYITSHHITTRHVTLFSALFPALLSTLFPHYS